MKTAGIIGGIGPESTIDYYRLIVAGYRERKRDGSYPSLVINSIDLQKILTLIGADRLAELSDYLAYEIQKLARAGADFGLLASNTPHRVFDELQRLSPIPLISIVEITREAAVKLGLKRLGLLGTRFTMQADFYPDVMRKAGIAVVAPAPREQDYIHDVYMNELLNSNFRPESRAGILAIVGRLKTEEKIDGVVLGGTELPLLLRDVEDQGVPFLDTTKLHVEQVVARLLQD
jgi:aspartate racemase